MKNALRFERYIDAREFPEMLRRLADAVEKGTTGDDSGLLQGIEHFQEFKLSAKEGFGKLHLKVRVKCHGGECVMREADSAKEPLPYKQLKRRMQTGFKMILTMLREGSLPPEEAVDLFLEDSRRMVGHAGYGDAMYDEYTAAVRALAGAHASRDVGGMLEAALLLNTLKLRCHKAFK